MGDLSENLSPRPPQQPSPVKTSAMNEGLYLIATFWRRVSLKLNVELTTNLLLADMVVHPPRLVATEALVGMEAAGASLRTSPLDDHVSSETLPTDDVAEAVAV